MRSYSRWFLSLAMFSVVTLITVSSSAKTVNRLADVSFVSASDRIEVRITPSISLKPAQISATIDGSLLVIRAEDSTARRRWVNARDTDIKRVLVAPPKASKTTASIRIRFKNSISDAVVRNIRVRTEGKVLIAAIPRTAVIAAFWEKGSAKPTKKVEASNETSPTPEVKPDPKATTVTAANEASSIVEITGPMLPVVEMNEPLVNTAPTSAESETVTNGLAQPDLDPAGQGVVIVSLIVLGLLGLVFWKKMRTQSTVSGDGPMIKPVGTHMLGPKQGLLLVDVAGQMVLLGTSDKGVQMLTKIENAEQALSDSDLAARVKMNGPRVAQKDIDNAGRKGFTERFGRALERIRGAASGHAQVRNYGEISDQVHATSADDDILSRMANRVNDVTTGHEERRTKRRDFQPVTPYEPQPPHMTQPPVDDQDALLAKLRSLQSA